MSMRKILFSCAFVAVMGGVGAQASDVGFNVGINIGNGGGRSAPVYAPAYAPAPVAIEEPPVFVAPPELGFYVAAGVPYDLFYVSGRYYLSRDSVWYSSSYYNGPWVTVGYRFLPWELRRHPFARVRYYRDAEFRRYCDGGHYGGRHFRPEWREVRHEERERWREARRWEHERREHGRRWRHGGDDD